MTRNWMDNAQSCSLGVKMMKVHPVPMVGRHHKKTPSKLALLAENWCDAWVWRPRPSSRLSLQNRDRNADRKQAHIAIALASDDPRPEDFCLRDCWAGTFHKYWSSYKNKQL